MGRIGYNRPGTQGLDCAHENAIGLDCIQPRYRRAEAGRRPVARCGKHLSAGTSRRKTVQGVAWVRSCCWWAAFRSSRSKTSCAPSAARSGRYLPAIPDGEVGERRSWVLRLSYQVFNGHIDLDTIKRPRARRRRRAADAARPRRRLAVQGQARRRSSCASAIRAIGSATPRTRRIPTSCSRRCARKAYFRAACAFRSRCRWSTAWSAR